MEKVIEEQTAGRRPDEVEELNLDNCDCSQITGLTDEYTNLETLTLSNNSLTSLKGFPNLPNLRKLDLSDNQISDGLELLSASPNLEFLNLSNNPLKDISSLEALTKLKQLQSLEVFNCELTNNDDYRTKIFEQLEDVLFVDGFDREGQPAPNEDDEDQDDEGDEGSEDDEGESEEGGEGHEEGDEADEGSDEDAPERGTKRKHEDDEDA